MQHLDIQMVRRKCIYIERIDNSECIWIKSMKLGNIKLSKFQMYNLFMCLLFLCTTLYIALYKNTFNTNWLILFIFSTLYFNSEKILKLVNNKVFYLLVFIIIYVLSKFLKLSCFYVVVDLSVAISLTSLFFTLFFISLFRNSIRKRQ